MLHESPSPFDLRAPFLPISRVAAVEVGPASLTLAAIDRMLVEAKSSQLFTGVGQIARRAGRSPRSAASDIALLDAKGWILNVGRQPAKTLRGRRRRTTTLVLGVKAQEFAKPYHRFPEWATGLLPRWSDRVVYGAVVSVALLVADKELEDHGRERLTLSSLCRATGLSRPTVVKAKDRLEALGLLEIDRGGPGYSDHLFAVDPPGCGKKVAVEVVKKLQSGWLKSCSRKEEALRNKHLEGKRHVALATSVPFQEQVA